MKLDFMEQIRSRVDMEYGSYLKDMINLKDYLNSEYLPNIFWWRMLIEQGNTFLGFDLQE